MNTEPSKLMAPKPSQRRRKVGIALFVALAAFVYLIPEAVATDLRGSLRFTEGMGKQVEASNSYYWKVWNGYLGPIAAAKMDKARASRQVAVVLTAKGAKKPTGCDYALQGGNLHPSTIVVGEGQSLRITNKDGCSHELYSDDLASMTPLQTASGNPRVVEVPAGGPYHVADRTYGHVNGTIHAIKNLAACGKVSGTGYSFKNIAPGTYTLRVFMGDAELHSRKVEVTDRSELEIDAISLSPKAE